jgi:NTE family protein
LQAYLAWSSPGEGDYPIDLMLNLPCRLLGLLLLVMAPWVYAQESPGTANGSRPGVGLVLSGGGARGAAHVGVLKVLEEMRIPIDAIAGTSMGAVVGGLYASGMSAAQIEREMASVDWQDAFRDRPSRRQLTFRRKQEDREFLVQLPLGFRDGDFQLPSGLIQGQKLSQLLRALTLPAADIQSFDDLPTPFRAIATDLETGSAVVLQDGDLATALRASMSAPGIFAPVERDGQLLVDGGVSNNLPVDIARAMNVDRLIVVDVGFPLAARDELGSVTNVANQMLTILIRRETQKQLESLGPSDLLVSPALPTTSSYGFSSLRKIMAAGEQGAREIRQQLEGLALSADQYERYVANRARAHKDPQIRSVATLPGSEAFSAPISTLFGDLAGAQLDLPELTRRINRYYGQGLLESLDFRLQAVGDAENSEASDLLFAVRPNSWGPTYVRFGLRLQDDFAGNASFDAAARVLFTDFNRTGAEWVWDAQLGGNPRFGTAFYLPLSQRRRWFVEPAALLEIRSVPQFEADKLVGELRVRSVRIGTGVGREIGQSGEFRVGAEHEDGRSRVRFGDFSEPPLDFHNNEVFARYSFDSFDNAAFPRRGKSAKLEWRGQVSGRVLDRVSDSVSVDLRIAQSWGKNTVLAWGSAGTLLHSDFADARSLFPLGGFLNLSAAAPDSLQGPNFAISRLVYFRNVGTGGEGFLNVPMYAGMSLEAGNVWKERAQMTLGSARKDMSLFFGLDTFLGPAWLAAGLDSKGRHAFYLSLGRGF